MSFVDPIDPPEAGAGSMKAVDTINKVCLIRPTGWGEWDPKPEVRDAEGNITQKADKARPYCIADVWVLDRAGIVEEGTDVRFSWWRAVEQLRPVELGSFVLAMPVTQDDRSVILVKTSKQEWRDIGATAVKEITGGVTEEVNTGNEYEPGEEVF